MHIAFVLPAYAPFVGGAQTVCRALAQRLRMDGHRVIVLTSNAQQADDFWRPPPSIRADLPSREEQDGVQIIRLPLTYPWPAPYRFGVLRRMTHLLARLPLPVAWLQPLLRHFTPSLPPLLELQSVLLPLLADADLLVVLDAGWDGLFVDAAQAALAQATPVIVMPLIHTGSPAIKARFCMAHQTAVYQQAGATVALSQSEKALLAEWGVAPSRLHCLSLGVDAVDLDEARQDGEAIRQRYGLPRQFVLFLGAATYDKGAFTLAQAVADLIRQGEVVDIVCAGPQQHQLAVFLDIFPPRVGAILREHIHLLGVVDERTKQALLAECALLALPSRVDSFGIVLLEAWQHSKPVVAAAIGGPAALVRHEETGLLVPFDASLALAAAIQQILAKPELAERLGSAGHRTLTEHYTLDKCYDAFSQIATRISSPTDGASNECL
ncbi:MAG: glycosyltransferase family 4 protein [Caldilineaceae bacterium]|nr:glycosyltransferase family 4 protein [Caldilineaceae bacterium]